MGDLFWLAVRNVLHRRLRSWLTVIGILIGTAAVVALISIGQGLERSITQQVERIMGFNTLLITPEG
ncbi:ABC transporter permease, partial [Candidatus Acetothermia bacterium]